MPAPTDPASAARRVVASLADGVMPSVNDLFALLPVLDVIARERAEDRVGPFDLPELPRPAVCYADHSFPAYSAQQIKDFARAAIALADAEAVARRRVDDDAAHRWVREIYEASGGATPALREAYAAYQAWERESADAPPSTRP